MYRELVSLGLPDLVDSLRIEFKLSSMSYYYIKLSFKYMLK